MAESTDLFARRNRIRIAALILLATLNYCLAIAAAAVAVGLGLLLTAIFQLEVIPTDADGFTLLGLALLAVIVISAVVGLLLAVFKIPFARRTLERRVFRETGARIATPSEHVEIKNVLEALAIAAGIPVPRFAVIEESAPNSFGVGYPAVQHDPRRHHGVVPAAQPRRAGGGARVRGQPHPELGRRLVELDGGPHEWRDLGG